MNKGNPLNVSHTTKSASSRLPVTTKRGANEGATSATVTLVVVALRRERRDVDDDDVELLLLSRIRCDDDCARTLRIAPGGT
jgi:hypothetical protein